MSQHGAERAFAVLYLVREGCDQRTVAALEDALIRARAGKIVGISMSYWERGGEEDHVCTGPYRDRPAEAVRAALRASMILTQMEGERRGCPV
jgi:hypothetical protein